MLKKAVQMYSFYKTLCKKNSFFIHKVAFFRKKLQFYKMNLTIFTSFLPQYQRQSACNPCREY